MGKLNHYIINSLLILFLVFLFVSCGKDEVTVKIDLTGETTISGTITVSDFAWNHPDFGDLKIEWAPTQGVKGSGKLINLLY